MFSSLTQSSRGLLKQNLAAMIREEILTGRLAPGEPVVETQWAPRLKVAQTSIREAINILVSEGFIEKDPGRSARVVGLSREDLVQLYQLRAVVEGLAARLACERKADLTALKQAAKDIDAAVRQENTRIIVERDFSFHYVLSQTSGNRFVVQQASQILVPCFAFTLIRTLKVPESIDGWRGAIQEHESIVDGIESGDPAFAEQNTRHIIGKFANTALSIWGPAQEQVEAEVSESAS